MDIYNCSHCKTTTTTTTSSAKRSNLFVNHIICLPVKQTNGKCLVTPKPNINQLLAWPKNITIIINSSVQECTRTCTRIRARTRPYTYIHVHTRTCTYIIPFTRVLCCYFPSSSMLMRKLDCVVRIRDYFCVCGKQGLVYSRIRGWRVSSAATGWYCHCSVMNELSFRSQQRRYVI